MKQTVEEKRGKEREERKAGLQRDRIQDRLNAGSISD